MLEMGPATALFFSDGANSVLRQSGRRAGEAQLLLELEGAARCCTVQMYAPSGVSGGRYKLYTWSRKSCRSHDDALEGIFHALRRAGRQLSARRF
jgi:hypothetical protein